VGGSQVYSNRRALNSSMSECGRQTSVQ